MKSSIIILLISFLCTIGVFSQSQKIFDSTIGESVVKHNEIIPENPHIWWPTAYRGHNRNSLP
jgi:hypothetical protein